MSTRSPAVAGSWYPSVGSVLADTVDRLLDDARDAPPLTRLVALVAPHAGLMYSGPVAAFSYRLLRTRHIDVVVLVGPSHFVGFDGAAIYARGAFETPLGLSEIDEGCAAALLAETPAVHEDQAVHRREHSLEMQLPFIQRVAPSARIVPLLMGFQTAATAEALGTALGAVLRGRNAVIVASTDLSHYHDALTASRLDGVVVDHLARFDPDGLQRSLDQRPDHACGGGPTVAVMRAARNLGANCGVVLDYADSGDVSGDKSSVVGYVAAAFGESASGN
jgi:AmmeMemoRadiSam system protein B